MVHLQKHRGSLPKGQGKWTRVGMGKDKRTRLHQSLADSTLSPL